jgi:hypothetical protein
MPALQEFHDSTLYLIRAETAVSEADNYNHILTILIHPIFDEGYSYAISLLVFIINPKRVFEKLWLMYQIFFTPP